MKEYFGLFILIFLTFSFFSCEKKSLNEKLQEEVNSKKNNLSKKEKDKHETLHTRHMGF